MLKKGQVLNDTYEVLEEIGSGGGGTVYKARHMRMNRLVAIKLVRDDVVDKVDVRAEMEILKDLKHNNLPMVMDYVETEGQIYTVMEFITGKNLEEMAAKGKRFTEADVCLFMYELCDAVSYLHSRNPPIIHSDIKPANIMLTDEETIYLIDFNISSVSKGGKAVSYGGSRGYAAPEQFKKVISTPNTVEDFHEATRFMSASETAMFGNKTDSAAYVDIRTDIYGIGATMFALITGTVPRGGVVNTSGWGFSGHVKKIIEKATATDPEKRYRSAYDMKQDIAKASRTVHTTVIKNYKKQTEPFPVSGRTSGRSTSRSSAFNTHSRNTGTSNETEIISDSLMTEQTLPQKTVVKRNKPLKVIIPAAVSAVCIIAAVAIIVTDRENTIANTDVIVESSSDTTNGTVESNTGSFDMDSFFDSAFSVVNDFESAAEDFDIVDDTATTIENTIESKTEKTTKQTKKTNPKETTVTEKEIATTVKEVTTTQPIITATEITTTTVVTTVSTATEGNISQKTEKTTAVTTISRTPEWLETIITAEVYDVVKLGDYEWYIIEKNTNGCKLLCKDILEKQMTYNEERKKTTWEKCSLREWLNSEFYNTFSDEEKKYIKKSKCVNKDNDDRWVLAYREEYTNYGRTPTEAGNDTEDFIFLLSIDEAENVKSKIREASYWWWLRSPGNTLEIAAGVNSNGTISAGGNFVNAEDGVRPALCLEY